MVRGLLQALRIEKGRRLRRRQSAAARADPDDDALEEQAHEALSAGEVEGDVSGRRLTFDRRSCGGSRLLPPHAHPSFEGRPAVRKVVLLAVRKVAMQARATISFEGLFSGSSHSMVGGVFKSA
jgi:hypothetical protein